MPDTEMSSGNVSNILLLLVIVVVGVFIYLEFRKLNRRIDELAKRCQRPSGTGDPANPSRYMGPVGNVGSFEMKQGGMPLQAAMPLPGSMPLQGPAMAVSEPDIDPEGMIEALMEGMPEPNEGPIPPIREVAHGPDVVHEPGVAHGPEVAHEVVTDPYSAMTVNQLKALLDDRNLPTTGNKSKLRKRLQEGDIGDPILSVKDAMKASDHPTPAPTGLSVASVASVPTSPTVANEPVMIPNDPVMIPHVMNISPRHTKENAPLYPHSG